MKSFPFKKGFVKCALLLAIGCSTSYAAKLYVDAAAISGNRSGASWSNAYTRLDSALMNSFSGDTIWVKAGRYYPVGSKTSAYFNIPSGRKLFGGFKGTETTENDRDLNTNKTYLDGDIGTKSQASDNSMNVLRISSASPGTLVNGFQIVNGYAYSAGGGITIGGGGMRIIGGSPEISQCVFSDNYTYMRGGAVYIENSATPVFNQCVFTANSTGNDVNSLGGALFSNSGTSYYNDCRFDENSSQKGGAIALNATGRLSRCTISGNQSNNGGGAAIYMFDNGILHLHNSLIAGNSASSTSVIYMSGTFNQNAHVIVNCTFTDNKVGGANSTVLQDNSSTYVRNCIFWNNSSNAQIYYFPTAVEPIVSNCIVSGGYNYGTNILTGNPQFVNPSSPQNAPFNASGYNYRIKAGSAAVDAGDSTFIMQAHKTDLLKNIRIQSNNADLGAYESNYSAWKITATGSGSGSAGGSGTYASDSTVRVVAQPDSCGRFYRWTENGQEVSLDSVYTFTATGNRTLTAEFKKKLFSISGVVNTSPAYGSIGNTGLYMCSDSTYTLVAVPARCMRFVEWRENNKVVGTSVFFNFKPTGNRQLTAVFTKTTYTASATVAPAGSGTVSGSGTYGCDSIVKLKAKASPGYLFSAWKENGNTIGTDTLLQYAAAGNRNFTAHFTANAGLEETRLQARVYPNPFYHAITIKCPEIINSSANGATQFRLLTMQGAVVQTGHIHAKDEMVLSLEWLSAGLYTIELRQGNKVWRELVEKAR